MNHSVWTQKKIIALLLIVALCLTACKNDTTTDETGVAEGITGSDTTDEKANPDFIKDNTDGSADNTNTIDFSSLEIDTELKLSSYDTEEGFEGMSHYYIKLSDDGSEILGTPLAYDSSETTIPVEIAGSTVKITGAGVFHFEGTLCEGRILVNAADDDHINLRFEGITVTSTSGSPIYIENAKKTVISLSDGANNTITDNTPATTDSTETTSACIYSSDDLTMTGNGTLTLQGTNNGIVSKDKLKIVSGNYVVTAGKNGLRGKDCLAIWDGNFTITSANDALKSNGNDVDQFGFTKIFGGTFDIEAGGDGIYGEYLLQIEAGDFTITSTAKALKSQYSMVLIDGTYQLSASDDAIHSNTLLAIQGGSYTIATSDDGIHADDTLTIDDGKITITKSYEGLEAVTINLNGGDISIVASDDGINANSGDVSFGAVGNPWMPDNKKDFDDMPVPGGMQSPDDMPIPGDMQKPDDMQFPGAMQTPSDIQSPNTAQSRTEATSTSDSTLSAMGMHGGMGGDLANSATMITITGGSIFINAGGDGIDSNGSITMTGGTVIVEGPTNNGNGALDYAGTFSYEGGMLLAIGASGMAQSVTPATDCYAIYVTYTANQSANTTIRLIDETGAELLSYTPSKSFSSLIFGSPELTTGTVTLYSGENALCTFTIDTNATSIRSDGSTGYEGGMWNTGNGKPNGGWGGRH